MQYTKKAITTGAWVDKKVLVNGSRAKIVSETKPVASKFTDDAGNAQTQDVCKVHFEGQKEPVNVGLNRATIDGLVDAFGDDSNNWQGHYLTVETEKMRVGGRAVIALYLIPEGYVKVDDENGYATILKKPTESVATTPPTTVDYPTEPNPDDIKF